MIATTPTGSRIICALPPITSRVSTGSPLGSKLAIKFEQLRPILNDEAGKTLRSSDLRRPHIDQERQALLHLLADRGHELRALRHCQPRPGTIVECLARGLHRPIDVGSRSFGHSEEALLCDRRNELKLAIGLRFDPFAANIKIF